MQIVFAYRLRLSPTCQHNCRNRLLVLSLLLACAPSAELVSAGPYFQWPARSGGNNHYYGLTDSASSWTTAQSSATSLGGDLVSITSAGEQSFIDSTFLIGGFATKPLWIGLTDQTVEGTFVWVHGEPL